MHRTVLLSRIRLQHVGLVDRTTALWDHEIAMAVPSCYSYTVIEMTVLTEARFQKDVHRWPELGNDRW